MAAAVVATAFVAVAVVVAQKATQRLQDAGLDLLAVTASKIDTGAMNKVFAAFDKMSTDLKQQLEDESDKRDKCNKRLHENSMDLLESKNTIDALKRSINKNEQDKKQKEAEIKTGQDQIADIYYNIQQAGMDRADENKEFQAAQDNGNKIAFVLKKVYTVLEQQYAQPKSFLQQPSRAVFGDNQPPVPALKSHTNSPAGGVLTMMQEIMSDNAADLKVGLSDENHKQAAYSKMLSSSFASVKNLQKKIVSDQSSAADLSSSLEDQGEQKDNEVESFMDLGKEKETIHTECDFLIKNFDFRQEKIKDEIDAISDAKAILSGADM